MIRLHIWDNDETPPLVTLPDGDVQILDYAHHVGFEIGDQIQYLTDLGTTCYFVVDVDPVWDGEREMRIVSIQNRP